MEEVKKLRQRVPKFRRQEAHTRKRLTKSGWRAPRGAQSKLRRYHKSKGALVRVGYRIPRIYRGLIHGKEPIRVENVSMLKGLDKDKYIVVVSAKVGMKKKLDVVKEAVKLGLEIQNIDVKKYEAFVAKKLATRKANRKARKAKKQKKAKKAREKEEKAKAKELAKKKEAKKKEAKKDNVQKAKPAKTTQKKTSAEPQKPTVSKETAAAPIEKKSVKNPKKEVKNDKPKTTKKTSK